VPKHGDMIDENLALGGIGGDEGNEWIGRLTHLSDEDERDARRDLPNRVWIDCWSCNNDSRCANTGQDQGPVVGFIRFIATPPTATTVPATRMPQRFQRPVELFAGSPQYETSWSFDTVELGGPARISFVGDSSERVFGSTSGHLGPLSCATGFNNLCTPGRNGPRRPVEAGCG
jgi:hypothetical protein